MFNRERLQRFSIRKLTVGAASVLIGVSFMTEMSSNKVYADVRTTNENSNSQVHDNSDGNTLNLSTDLKSKADEAGTADSEVTNNSNAKVGGDGFTDNSNARNVEIKNIDNSKKDQQSGDAVAPKEKTANTIQKHEKNVAKGTTVDLIDLQVAKAQADIAATKINGKASSVVSPQIKQIQAKYQISKNLPLEKQINPTDENSDGKVVVKAEDPSNYPRDLNNLIGGDKYIYSVLSLNGSRYPDSKLILSVNRNDSNDKNIYAYVIDNNGEIKTTATVGVDQNKNIDINGRGYRINNDGSSNIIIGDNKESTQNSSTVTSAPGYYWWDGYHPYSNVNPIEQGYGLGNTPNGKWLDISEIVPVFTENSVIKYYYRDNKGHLQKFKKSEQYPNVIVKGFTGQKFEIDNVDKYKRVIQGYHLTSDNLPTGDFKGTLSQFSDDKYYKNVFYDFDTDTVNYFVLYHQISPDGTMEVYVFDDSGNLPPESGVIAPNGSIEFSNYNINVPNPYVTAAPHEVQFIYTKNGKIIPVDKDGHPIKDADQPVFPTDPKDPSRVVSGKIPDLSAMGYHPLTGSDQVDPDSEDPSKDIEVKYVKSGTITVKYHDNTENSFIEGYGKDVQGNEDDKFSYDPTNDLKTLTDQGYVLDGALPTIPAKFTDGAQAVIINLKHGVVPVTPGTDIPKKPDGSPAVDPNSLTKEVDLKVNYVNSDRTTFTGEPPANQNQKVTFTGTAYVDKVTGKLVNAKQQDGTWVVDDSNTHEPQIIWKADDKDSFDAVISPVENGYHLTGIDSHGKGNNVEEITGLTQDSGSIRVTVTYTKNGKIIPVDKDGHPIKDADQPVFPTDPKDPSRVVSGKIPDLSAMGYHPLTGSDQVDPDSEDPSKDIEVKYVKSGTITVKYHDNTENSFIEGYGKDVQGNEDDKFSYDPATDLATLEEKGYVLDEKDNKVPDIPAKFTATDQIVTIHLKHGTVTVTTENPQKPDTSINPDPQSPKYPKDISNTNKDVKRTIDYKYSDGKTAQPTVTDSLHFERTVVIDKVTGDVVSDTWTPSQDFNDIQTPAISGYTPDKKVVSDKNIGHDHQDIIEHVVYNPDKQFGHIEYIDDDANDDTKKTLISDDFSGDPNEHEDYKPTERIQEFENKGYELVSSDYPDGGFNFDDNDQQEQVFHVHLKHGTITVTPENPGKPGEPINPGEGSANYPDGTDKTGLTDTVNRTITYVMIDGSKAPDAVHDSLSYTASKVIDKVTGEVLETETKWSANQDFKDVDSPSVKGYKPDKKTVSNKNVAHDAADITETVKYSADAQKASVTYVDDNTGKPLKVENLNGVTNAKSGYTTKGAIDTYTGLGYTLVSDDTKGKEVVFDNDDAVDQAFNVHLKHGIVTVTPENPGKPGEPVDPDNPDGPKYPDGTEEFQVKRTGTQTIHYVGAGDKTSADNKQTFVFTREITFDNVTGEIISVTPWNIDSHTFGTVKTPVIPGYHADKVVAGGATVTPDDLNKVITVTYAPDGNPGNPSDHGDIPSPEPTPEPETTPNPTPDDQHDSEISSDEHFENVKPKDKLDKTNPKKVDAYKKQRKIIKTKIAKQGHTEIAEPIEDKVTRENNVKVVSDPVENKAAEPKLPQTGEADNSIIGLLGMLLASFAAMFGFDSLHSHDKKHKN